jgi:flagella basal body P-ring formation protein FlgA
VRTSRAIAAGVTVVTGDLVVVRTDAPGVLIEALPARDSVVGMRTVRALAAGEVVTSRVVRILPLVRSGDRVVIHATIGSVRITGAAMAQQTGGIGDVIRLVNPDSRRVLRGRIVGKGEVEVMHGS